MMNFITAIILLFFVGLFNTVSLNSVYVDGSTIKGLNNGDKIVAINDHFVNNYDKLALEMTIAGNEEFKMTLKNKEGKNALYYLCEWVSLRNSYIDTESAEKIYRRIRFLIKKGIDVNCSVGGKTAADLNLPSTIKPALKK